MAKRVRWWPRWWWRYPFSTGIFSPWVPEDYSPQDDIQNFVAPMTPAGGSPPPDAKEKES